MESIKSLCIFCGASSPERPEFGLAIEALADELVRRQIALVYGGGNVGLMGQVAGRVLAGGGRVIGVIPHQLQARELAHHELTELILVDSMHDRKRIMYDRSDAFVAFPGGFGTLDEMMEILTWKQLGIHGKPVVFANVAGYFAGLASFFDRAIAEGLLKAEYVPLYHFAPDVPGVFSYLADYVPAHGNVASWG